MPNILVNTVSFLNFGVTVIVYVHHKAQLCEISGAVHIGSAIKDLEIHTFSQTFSQYGCAFVVTNIPTKQSKELTH